MAPGVKEETREEPYMEGVVRDFSLLVLTVQLVTLLPLVCHSSNVWLGSAYAVREQARLLAFSPVCTTLEGTRVYDRV